MYHGVRCHSSVAPFVGAWIEIQDTLSKRLLKKVAPFVGAWIEISCTTFFSCSAVVAPFVGAWIEKVMPRSILKRNTRSLRSSERGLKIFQLFPDWYVALCKWEVSHVW